MSYVEWLVWEEKMWAQLFWRVMAALTFSFMSSHYWVFFTSTFWPCQPICISITSVTEPRMRWTTSKIVWGLRQPKWAVVTSRRHGQLVMSRNSTHVGGPRERSFKRLSVQVFLYPLTKVSLHYTNISADLLLFHHTAERTAHVEITQWGALRSCSQQALWLHLFSSPPLRKRRLPDMLCDREAFKNIRAHQKDSVIVFLLLIL